MNDGGRPAAAPPADVTVSLQLGYEAGKPPSVERILGTVSVTSGFKPYTVPIPPDLAARRGQRRADPAQADHDACGIPQQVLGTAGRPRPRA